MSDRETPLNPRPKAPLPGSPWLLVILAITAGAATAAPLLIYTVSLAAFGLPHVLAELRYVDLAFRRRLTRGAVGGFLVWLAALFLLRAAHVGGAFADTRAPLELIILIALILVAMWQMPRSQPLAMGAAIGLALLVITGCVIAPAITLVVMALLHNLTPVGFLAERLRGTQRRRALGWCAIGFGIAPLLIATGLPRTLLSTLGLSFADATPFLVGPVTHHLGAFVPAPWIDAHWALDLFSAAVYLQVLHYAVVIHVLPRLLDESDDAPSTVRWPRPSAFARMLAAVGVITLVGFALSFGDARRAYGVFAAVHAWIEIPLLLLTATAWASPVVGRSRVA